MSDHNGWPRFRLIDGLGGPKSDPRPDESGRPQLQVLHQSDEPGELGWNPGSSPETGGCHSTEEATFPREEEIDRSAGSVIAFLDTKSVRPHWFDHATNLARRIELLVNKRKSSTDHLPGGGAA